MSEPNVTYLPGATPRPRVRATTSAGTPPQPTAAELRSRAFHRVAETHRGDQQRQVDAIGTAFKNGMLRGRDDGYRQGFTSGTHWGMACGALLGMFLSVAAYAIARVLCPGWSPW